MHPSLKELQQETNTTPLDTGFDLLQKDHKNQSLYTTLKKVCFLGAIIHILFIFFFLSIGALWLSIFNILSVLTWLLTLYQIQQGRYRLATLMGTIEIVLHAAFATHVLGLSMGFLYFLWPTASLIMISNIFTHQKSTILGFSIIILFAALTIYAKDIPYQYAFPQLAEYIQFANISFAAFAFVLINMSSRTKNTKNDKRLYELSNKDALTGVYNRHFVYELMAQVYSERRGSSSLDYTVVLADIDNFKEINEAIGHVAGDEVIKSVASYLQTAVRETDIVARWSGEQFMLILMKIDYGNTQTLIEKIRKNIRYQIITEGLRERVTTLSFGVAKATGNEPIEETIKRADLSMYKAKKLGRDRIIYAD